MEEKVTMSDDMGMAIVRGKKPVTEMTIKEHMSITLMASLINSHLEDNTTPRELSLVVSMYVDNLLATL